MEMSTFFASAPSGMATEAPSPSETIAPDGPTVADPPDFLHPTDSTTTNAASDRPMPDSPGVQFYHAIRLYSAALFAHKPRRGSRAETAPGDRAAAHLRHHLASGRGQDHAHRKAALARRGHPSRRRGQGARRAAARDLRLDGSRAAARDRGA